MAAVAEQRREGEKIKIQGVFSHWYPPKELKYGKSGLGESMLTLIDLDTPNLA